MQLNRKLLLVSVRLTLVSLSAVILIFPIFWMITTSIRSVEAVFLFPPRLVIWPVTFKPFLEALKWMSFWRYLWNTFYVSLLGSIGISISSSFVAYGFTRIKWPGRDTFFSITLATMMLPYAVYMIPLYLVWHNLGLLGTFKPLWVPFCFGNAFSIFLISQMYRGIPDEISDAAKVDGCSEFRIWAQIMLPLVKSVIILVFLLHFTNMWKEFYLPFIYINEKKMYTLTLALYNLQGGTVKPEWNVIMAAATMISLLMLVLVPITQKGFGSSHISFSGIKG